MVHRVGIFHGSQGYIRVKKSFILGKIFKWTYRLVLEYTQIYLNIYLDIPKYTQICTKTLTYGICRKIGFVAIHAPFWVKIVLKNLICVRYLTNDNSDSQCLYILSWPWNHSFSSECLSRLCFKVFAFKPAVRGYAMYSIHKEHYSLRGERVKQKLNNM